MKKKIEKLTDVKSIITLILTAVFAVLLLNFNILEEQFLTVFTAVTAFYFGVQYQKKGEKYDSNE